MSSADDLLVLFQKMGTTDHEVLIKQFQTIVEGVDDDTCRFFLEANNWTLQNAIASFFDYGGPSKSSQNVVRPKMSFMSEPDDGKPKPAGTPFTKRWRIQNSGNEKWPHDCTIEFIGGQQLNGPDSQRVPALPPGQHIDMSVNLVTPPTAGTYAGSWMMCTNNNGMPIMFGEPIWVIVTVEADINPFQQPGAQLGATPVNFPNPPNLFGAMPQQHPPQSHLFGPYPNFQNQTTPFSVPNQSNQANFGQNSQEESSMDM